MGVCGSKLGKNPKNCTIDITSNNQNNNEQALSKTEQFLNYIKEAKSKNTYKSYKRGIALFEEFYGKTSDVALKERREDIASEDFQRNRRFAREIEKFHAWMLKEGYTINSARANTIGIRQLFKFYGMPITLEAQSSVSKTVITTKDFVPTIEQYRSAFNCSDLQTRIIISMGLDLGWRIGDFLSLKIEDIPDLNQPTPIPFELITEKEDVISKTFLSAETVELLKTYIPTLKENPYLFPSNGKGALKGEAINYKIREAFKKAKIMIPKGKRLRFHAFRKRFLSTCANLKIDVNIAKILCGKSVEKSMLTYLSEVEHKNAFIEVKQVLSVTNGRIKSTMQAKDVEITRLQKQIEELRLTMKGMMEIYGEEIMKKAIEKLKGEGKITTLPIKTQNEIKIGKITNITELLQAIGKAKEKEQRKEYEKIIAENNNNHNKAENSA